MAVHAGQTGISDEFPVLDLDEIRVGHRVVLAVGGELDIGTAPALGAGIDRVVEARVAELWIDLSRVAFMDSTGLRVLLTARRQLRARSLAIVCPAGPVRRVFALAGLEREFAIYADRAAAQAAR